MLLYISTFEIVLHNFAISNLSNAISKSSKLGCANWKLRKLGCAIWKLRKLSCTISKLVCNFAILNLRSAILNWRKFANCAAHIYVYYQCRQDVNIRIATKTKWPSRWMYYASVAYISAKVGSSSLMKACLWTVTDGKASWIVNRHQRYRQGAKPERDKIANCSHSYSSYCCKIVYSNDSSVVVPMSCAFLWAVPFG